MDDENDDLMTRIKKGALNLMSGSSPTPGMGDVKEAESGLQRIDNPERLPLETLEAGVGLNRPVTTDDILQQRQAGQKAMEMGMGIGSVGKLQPAIQEIEGGFKYAPVIKKTAQNVGDALKQYTQSFLGNPESKQVAQQAQEAALEALRARFNR